MPVPEPSLSPLPDPPPPPAPVRPAPARRRSLELLARARRIQRRAVWLQTLAYAGAALLIAVPLAAWLGVTSPVASRWLLRLLPVGAVAVAALVALWRARRLVGDETRTARLVAERTPELSLDLLAAVELSRALGERHDFSSELARAFVDDVDRRAALVPLESLVDRRPTRRALVVLTAAVGAALLLLALRGAEVRRGLALAFADAPRATIKREPITGDVQLSYRYPAYTGREAVTIEGSTGDVSAPAGTEVAIVTRADRDVREAVLVVNGAQVPLHVEGRQLSGRFVLDVAGQYHVAFVDGDVVKAEGPDRGITVEPDLAPQVRISSPADGLELNPDAQRVTVVWEASDDYGLSSLDLVYRTPGLEPRRVALTHDDGRSTRGEYHWELGALGLKPGQTVSYYVEAKDNDAIAGPKTGASATLTLKLYSAAEHRREALVKAEALWERLVTHLADRMEAPDRPSPAPPEAALAQKPTDERARTLAQDMAQLADDIDALRDPVVELSAALGNIASELRDDTAVIGTNRSLLLRLTGLEATGSRLRLGDSVNGGFSRDVGRRLSQAIATDVADSERNVLYLEALLDREKLAALKELARELKADRAELTRLLEEFGKTKDADLQQQLLEQMEALRQRMAELQQRMAELTKGIRDAFMNRDALEQMMQEQDLSGSLDEVEKLVREGKTEEALKAMQRLAMQMDELLDALDEAGDRADRQADPELARMVDEFRGSLEQTLKGQRAVADETRELRDRYRTQQRERVARRGEALQRELRKKLDDVDHSYASLDDDGRFGLAESAARARADLEKVRQALDADDFDLASEAADRLEQSAAEVSALAEERRRIEAISGNDSGAARRTAERLARDQQRTEEVAEKLRDLFPPPGSMMSDADRKRLQELSKQQRDLERQGQALQQQMEAIGERAPVFDEDAQQQMGAARKSMHGAQEQLASKDPSRSLGEQQGAMQAMEALREGLERQGGKGGLPMPMRRQGGRGTRQEKVEIPDEDPNVAPREFRKDVMDVMKQGAPERYRDQNKRYYEELVK